MTLIVAVPVLACPSYIVSVPLPVDVMLTTVSSEFCSASLQVLPLTERVQYTSHVVRPPGRVPDERTITRVPAAGGAVAKVITSVAGFTSVLCAVQVYAVL